MSADGAPLPPARLPSQWADAQRDLGLRLLDGESAVGIRAFAKWVSIPAWDPAQIGRGPIGLVNVAVNAVTGAIALRRRKRRGPGGAFIGLWQPGRATGGPPDLVVPVRASDLPTPVGEGTAYVIGELAPNGAIVVEIGGCRLAPHANPQVPWGDLLHIDWGSDGPSGTPSSAMPDSPDG